MFTLQTACQACSFSIRPCKYRGKVKWVHKHRNWDFSTWQKNFMTSVTRVQLWLGVCIKQVGLSVKSWVHKPTLADWHCNWFSLVISTMEVTENALYDPRNADCVYSWSFLQETWSFSCCYGRCYYLLLVNFDKINASQPLQLVRKI